MESRQCVFSKEHLESWLTQGFVLSGYHDQASFVYVGWGEVFEVEPESIHPGPVLYWPNFDVRSSETKAYGYQFWDKLSVGDFEKILNADFGQRTLQIHKRDWKQPDFLEFQNNVSLIRSRFSSGLKKGVPVVFETASETLSLNELHLSLKNSCKFIGPAQYLYGSWSPLRGVLGLSPEILYARQSLFELETVALAGTYFLPDGHKATPEIQKSFLEDPKEKHEHDLVVNDLKSKLKALGFRVKVSDTFVEMFPRLMHLKTRLFANSSVETSMQRLIEALHPSSALGTYPSSFAKDEMCIWGSLKTRRGFGAPFAFKLENLEICYVAIRSLEWSSEGLRIGSGCGIVEQSVTEKEWLELQNKRNSVKRIFGI